MKGSLYKAAFTALLAAFIPWCSFGQIFDFNNEVPYQKVFVDTEDFDASYLDTLENNWSKAKEDTIRFSALMTSPITGTLAT